MGNEDAQERFTRLLIQHEPAILRHVMVAVPNRADARDVLQECVPSHFGGTSPGTIRSGPF